MPVTVDSLYPASQYYERLSGMTTEALQNYYRALGIKTAWAGINYIPETREDWIKAIIYAIDANVQRFYEDFADFGELGSVKSRKLTADEMLYLMRAGADVTLLDSVLNMIRDHDVDNINTLASNNFPLANDEYMYAAFIGADGLHDNIYNNKFLESYQIVEVLLKSGANPNIKDSRGRSLLQGFDGYPNQTDLSYVSEPEKTQMIAASERNKRMISDLLVKYGATY